MKYLLVSDIHGCRPALQKVLQFYDENHCDMLCVLGDILNYGPRNRIPEGIDAQGIVAEPVRSSPCVATATQRSIRCCSSFR